MQRRRWSWVGVPTGVPIGVRIGVLFGVPIGFADQGPMGVPIGALIGVPTALPIRLPMRERSHWQTGSLAGRWGRHIMGVQFSSELCESTFTLQPQGGWSRIVTLCSWPCDAASASGVWRCSFSSSGSAPFFSSSDRQSDAPPAAAKWTAVFPSCAVCGSSVFVRWHLAQHQGV